MKTNKTEQKNSTTEQQILNLFVEKFNIKLQSENLFRQRDDNKALKMSAIYEKNLNALVFEAFKSLTMSQIKEVCCNIIIDYVNRQLNSKLSIDLSKSNTNNDKKEIAELKAKLDSNEKKRIELQTIINKAKL